MNYDLAGHTAAAVPWCHPDGTGANAGDTIISFADMVVDYSTDDLYELVWDQEAAAVDGASGSRTMQPPLASCHWSSPPVVWSNTPSEDEMASWLCAIVKGEKLELNDHSGRQQTTDGRDVPAKGSSDGSTTTDTIKLAMPEGMDNKQEIRKAPAGGSSKRSQSHHREAHKLIEKRRRHKIAESLKTLQNLVPGCDKTNQALTLDQTIQYLKALQHQVQLMSVGPALQATAPVYPVPPQHVPPGALAAMPIPAAPMVFPAPPTMVPFGAMLQLPQYPAPLPMMMPTAETTPPYPVAARPVAPAGAESSASLRPGSSSIKGKSSRRRIR